MRDQLEARYSCAVELTLSVLGGKWKPVILAHLKEQPLRYGELRARIPRMSDKMLTQRLHELVELGFVESGAGDRGHDYQLSDEGRRLAPVLEALHGWGTTTARRFAIDLDNA